MCCCLATIDELLHCQMSFTEECHVSGHFYYTLHYKAGLLQSTVVYSYWTGSFFPRSLVYHHTIISFLAGVLTTFKERVKICKSKEMIMRILPIALVNL